MDSPNLTRAEDGPAIVTTLRAAGALLDDFVDYHLAVGFGRIYLIFDDPADPDRDRLKGRPAVEAITADHAWRTRWCQSPLFGELGASVDQEVMARQILNASVVSDLAREAGHDWLLQIDIDELFLPAAGDARALFHALRDQPVDVVSFANMEAVPEHEVVDRPFAEVSLFKVPVEEMRRRVAPDAALAETLRRSSRFGSGFFNLYSNGKSAVRLAAPGLQPFGVHDFDRPHGGAPSAGAGCRDPAPCLLRAGGFQVKVSPAWPVRRSLVEPI